MSLRERLYAALLPREEVLEAYLFGSSARGDAQDHSDIDVAVYVDKERLTPFYGAELSSHLMKLLQTDRVDVVLLNRASPLLYHRVLRDGERVIAKNLAQTTTREGRALSRYCDYQPVLAHLGAVLRKRIARGDFGR